MDASRLITELGKGLDDLMIEDTAWVQGRLQGARRRLEQGKPVDRMVQQIQARAQRSKKQVAARRQGVPAPEYDPDLPITAHRKTIIKAIQEHQIIVVAGETGSGKTTQIPKFCLEAGRGTRGLIGCTQPRRIAARAMAARVAEELGSELGGVVGFQVRFREKTSRDGYLKFMTDGILLAEAVGDRELLRYDTLIIDEAHERSLNIDFLLGYLHRLCTRRPELRIIITSATIDTEKFANHFGGAPIIEVSGRGFPVEVVYQPLEEEGQDRDRDNRDLYRGIVEAVHTLDRKGGRGDILVFLSGEREIHEARDALGRAGLRGTEILPLYARLSGAEQQRVFHPGTARRIILSTNVAETSLTVPRIRFVIDSGLARISRYAHRSRIQRLPIEPISQASANQRMGRCGRLGPGVCIRLYSETDFESRPEFTEPEILRTSLASVILNMRTMGLGAVEDFPFIDAPAPRMINDAHQLLFELGALDDQRSITPLGRDLARWPVDVRLGRMVLEGNAQGCLEDTLVLAAALSMQDPRERPLEAQDQADEAHERFVDEASDFSGLLALWRYLRQERKARSGNKFRKLCRKQFLAWQRVLEWFDLYQQLRDLAREQGLALRGGEGEFNTLHKAILAGLLSHVGQRHPEDRSYLGARNRNFHIFPGSGLFGKTPAWIMAAEIVETSKPYARINARIEPAWIEEQGQHLLKRTHFDPHWSRRQGKVMAWEQVSLFGLVLVEKRRVDFTDIDPEEARRLFIMEALVRGELDTRASFMEENRQAREAVEQLEHKRRQRDVLADEQDLFEFFHARIPESVSTARGLERWLQGLNSNDVKRLHLGQDVLLREDAGVAPETLYPDQWLAGNHAFELSYHFEPGEASDGVTLEVPLTLLNTLDPSAVSWGVPGLRRELITELLRTLPKPTRRVLTPLPQFAQGVMEHLSRPEEKHIIAALVEALKALADVVVAPADFEPEAIPAHLRMRIVVTDEDGAVLASERDLASLQEALGQTAQRMFMDRQGGGFNQDGLTEFPEAGIPEVVLTDDGAEAWPALVDQGHSVGLRLFDVWDEAVFSHEAGVKRLLVLALTEKFGWMRRQHGLSREGLMAWSVLGSVEELVDDLAHRALDDTVGCRAQTVRDLETWKELLSETRRRIGPVFQSLAGELSQSLERWGQANRELKNSASRLPESVVDDIRSQLDDMIYPGFLAELQVDRLAQFPRYLQGVLERLERAVLDPLKDQAMQNQVNDFWQRYQDQLNSGEPYSLELDAYRWLVAEYRVSVFAQRLGTVVKVSPKRLEHAWEAVQG